MNSDASNTLVKLPDLQLQVFSFFELAAVIAVALAVYYIFRKLLIVCGNLGFLERSSTAYKVVNILSFVLPSLVFLYGFSQVSKNSFFISLLFFVLVSFVGAFALIDPARCLMATMMIHLKGNLREGDFIVVGDAQGKIVQVGPLSLVIVSRGGNKVFLPTYKVLRMPYEVHDRGGGSTISLELSGHFEKQKIERLAHLCPYKRSNSDVIVTKKNDLNRLKMELHSRDLKPLVEKYFDTYL